ncbi:hypothetical protein ACX17A_23665 [Bacillus cereus]
MTEKCGGIVVEHTATSKGLLVLEEKNEEYIQRESELEQLDHSKN